MYYHWRWHPCHAPTSRASQSTYVFVWLQGLSIIPDLTHAVSINSTNTTADLNRQHSSQSTSSQNPNGVDFDLQHQHLSGASLINGSSVGNLNNKQASKPLNINSSSNRKQSSSSSTSSSSSSSSSSSTSSNESTNHDDITTKQFSEFIDFDEIADNSSNSLLVNFKCSLSDEKEVEWKTLLVNGILYVDIPSSVLPHGSRDSFVALLEFAEEKLECKKVYVCFKRNRPDRTSLMRVFMFFGFSVVPPGCQQVPQNDEIMSMVYNIQ